MTLPAERAHAGDRVLDVSLSCAWCFADEASEAAWAILSRLQSAQAHVPSLASRDQALQAAATSEGVPLLPT